MPRCCPVLLGISLFPSLVTDDYHFTYDRLIYEFNLDFQKPCLLHDVLDVKLKDKGRNVTRGDSDASRGWGSYRGRGGTRSSKGHDSLSSTNDPLDCEEPFELVGKGRTVIKFHFIFSDFSLRFFNFLVLQKDKKMLFQVKKKYF